MEATAAGETQANNMLNSSLADANAAGEGGTSRCRSHGSVSVEIELVDASTEDDDELLTYPPAFATAAEDYSHRVIYLSRDGKFHRSDSLTQKNMDINKNNGQGREGSVRADSCSATEGFSTGLVNRQHSSHTMEPPPSPSTAAAESNSSKMNMMDDSAAAASSSSTCSSSGDWEEREQYYYMRLSSSSPYWRQWADGMRPAVWGAALMASALDSLWGLAIGSWLASVSGSASHSDSGTHTSTTSSSCKMGATEAVLSTFMCGTLFAVLVSSPVFMVRLSVPCVVVLSSVNAAAQKLSLEFVPWMAWIAICTGTLLAFVAITCNTTTNTSTGTGTGTGTGNLSPDSVSASASASWPWLPLVAMPQQLGRFCSEIVHAFVGMCLIWHGMQQTVRLINKPDDDYASASASALLSLWFCTSCFLLGLILDLIRLVPLLPLRWRQTVANYGPVFVVVGLVAVSDVAKWSHINVPRLQMAEAGHHCDGSNLGKIVQLQHVPLWAIFLSLVPAAMLTALIILDCCSNWSMICLKENAKEQMMVWRRRDMLTLAGLLILCGFLGLPPCCGLFSQTKPCELSRKPHNSCKPDLERQAIYSREGRRQEIGAQRVCGFVSSLIAGIPLLPGIVSLLRHIPQPLLWGFCLQMGVHNLAKPWASYHMRKSRFGRASSSSSSSSSAEGLYTLLQIVSVGVMFSVSRTQAAMLFPLFLLTALWLKQHVMGRAFELKSNSKKQQNHFECKRNTVSPAGAVACGGNESGGAGSGSGNHGFGRSRIKWMKRKRKRHSSLDGGLNSSSSMSSSLRFVMKGREIAKRRRNRHGIYIGEEEQVDVHSNCLYDDAESGAGCHWLNCMDASSSAVDEEALSLRPPRLSFEDWAIPAAAVDSSSSSSFHSI